jgi:hypothetical protein
MSGALAASLIACVRLSTTIAGAIRFVSSAVGELTFLFNYANLPIADLFKNVCQRDAIPAGELKADVIVELPLNQHHCRNAESCLRS